MPFRTSGGVSTRSTCTGAVGVVGDAEPDCCMMEAHLFPKKKPNHKHWYAYDVAVDGEIVVTDSRDPEHDLARALLARGIKGMVTVLDGNTGKPRTIVNIEKAAPWCVGSNLERYKWKPPKASDHSPYAGEEDLVLPTMPVSDEEAA